MIGRMLVAFVVSVALVAGGGLPGALAGSAAAAAAEVAKVNINTASRAELMQLKRVGADLAERIIEYRQAHGPFKKPEEIRRVKGVGKGIWEANRQAITVE